MESTGNPSQIGASRPPGALLAPAIRNHERYAAGAIALAGLAVFCLHLYLQRFFLHDDALISLRFARNLAHAGALEWNLGERIEGYTNFLHVISTAALIKFGFDPVAGVRALNAACVVAMLAALGYGQKRLVASDCPSAVHAAGLALVLAVGPLPLWLYGGLETVMVAALVTAGAVCVLPHLDEKAASSPAHSMGRFALGGALFGCAILTRPDAAAITAVFAVSLLFLEKIPFTQRFKRCMAFAVPAGLIVLAHVLWRYNYYQDWLPNTFYAKVSIPLLHRLPNGLLYVARSMVELPALPLSIVLLVAVATRRTLSAPIKLLAFAVLIHAFTIVWAGGDHMPGARMMLPTLGLAALLAVVALSQMPREEIEKLAYGVAAIGILGGVAFGQEKMDKAAYYGTVVGQHLSRTEKPGTLVALSGAGAVPYHADGLRYIDMLGLIDRTIARRADVPIRLPWQNVPGHAKGDGAYILARKPDIIVLGPPSGTTADEPWFLSDIELAEHPEFKRCYRYVVTDLPISSDHLLAAHAVNFNPVPFKHYRRQCSG